MDNKEKDCRPRGRTSLYETAEELQAAVDQYFEECKGVPRFNSRGLPVLTGNGLQKFDYKRRATLSGLSHYLGFKDRQSFTRQKRRGPEFADVVAVARLRVEMQAEEALFDRSTYRTAQYLLRLAFGWERNQTNDVAPAGVEIINKYTPAATVDKKQH